MQRALTCPNLNFSLPLPDPATCASNLDAQRRCLEWRVRYHIRLGLSWGTFPSNLTALFHSLACEEFISLYLVAEYVQKNPHLFEKPWQPAHQLVSILETRLPGQDVTNHLPVIAVVVYVETCIYDLEDFFFLSQFLPSFFRHAEPGFVYWLIPAFHNGLVSDKQRDLLGATFERAYDTFLQETSIQVELLLPPAAPLHTSNSTLLDIRIGDVVGDAFNQAVAAAYARGATWIYCLDDYVSFQSPWARLLTRTLTEMSPPYGVVSPEDNSWYWRSRHLLPAYFTHRTHVDLFNSFFPNSLQSKMWAREWVSEVYGSPRTSIVHDAKIQHHLPVCMKEFGWNELSDSEYLYGELVRTRFVLNRHIHLAANAATAQYAEQQV